jgi:DNA-binding transcriptional regulator GbsR (MarR family)
MKNANTIVSVTETASSSLQEDEQQFIQQVATLLAPRGLSPSEGRVYGYMLLRQGPVSVDQIAMDLEMSRVSAWNAARNLEGGGHILRHRVPGSKRGLYAASDNFGTPMLEQAAILGEMGQLLQHCSDNIASGKEAVQLHERADFYHAIQQVMEEKVAEINAQRANQQQARRNET